MTTHSYNKIFNTEINKWVWGTFDIITCIQLNITHTLVMNTSGKRAQHISYGPHSSSSCFYIFFSYPFSSSSWLFRFSFLLLPSFFPPNLLSKTSHFDMIEVQLPSNSPFSPTVGQNKPLRALPAVESLLFTYAPFRFVPRHFPSPFQTQHEP